MHRKDAFNRYDHFMADLQLIKDIIASMKRFNDHSFNNRSAKVNMIKKAYETGVYLVNIEKVADKIIGTWISDFI